MKKLNNLREAEWCFEPRPTPPRVHTFNFCIILPLREGPRKDEGEMTEKDIPGKY